jgi:hypothetical protein
MDRAGRDRVATVTRRSISGLLGLLVGGCGQLQGLGGSAPPLVTFEVEGTGDLAPLRPAGVRSDRSLQVALIWGAQWLIEPFCILPPESDSAAAVIAAGCRDPFGFVPARVAASVPVTLGTTATLSLVDLPSADVLVGGVTSRMAYASLVLYDDRDATGTLDLSMSHPTATGDDGPPDEESVDSTDVIYGASFLTMTAPDQRVAFREGAFDEASAFYPRSGCPDPPAGFSVLGAGGFSAAAGLASASTGILPLEDPGTCATGVPSMTLVAIAAQDPATVDEVSCTERTNDGSTRYREPPIDAPDLTGRVSACAHLPSFDATTQPSLIQFVVSGRSQDHCKGLTHYTLRGCRENVACAAPDWDFTASPPAWWPCPT